MRESSAIRQALRQRLPLAMRHIMLVACVILAPATNVLAAEFFLLSQPERSIYRFDSDLPGKSKLIGSLGGEGALMVLLDAGNDELLTFDALSDEIITFNVAEAQVTGRVKLDRDIDEHIRGFALDSRGTLYGVFSDLKLATIDGATGVTTPLVSLRGAKRIEGIAFGPGNRLFASGSQRRDGSSESLYRVNIQNGALEPIGKHGFADVDTLTFGGDSYFYGTDSRAETTNELLRLSPRGGKADLVGDTGVRGVNGIALVKARPTRSPRKK
jgi:hypothetical protein